MSRFKGDSYWIEEAVALTDQAIEVGEGIHQLGPIGRVVGDDRKPESQLGEPHRGGALVYTEEIVLENAPLSGRETRPRFMPGQAVECSQ